MLERRFGRLLMLVVMFRLPFAAIFAEQRQGSFFLIRINSSSLHGDLEENASSAMGKGNGTHLKLTQDTLLARNKREC